MNTIVLKDITKIYKDNELSTVALNSVSCTLSKGEFVVLAGPSGSGKTTLTNILGCLDVASEGQYFFNNKDVAQLSETERTLMRRKYMGFVFQSYNLVPVLTVMENVSLASELMGVPIAQAVSLAKDLLERVGLQDHIHKFPRQLSGGQQQRVAIARALVKNPTLLLADEPSAHLDSKNTYDIITLLRHLNTHFGVTCVVCTHDDRILQITSRIIYLEDGRIISDTKKIQHG